MQDTGLDARHVEQVRDQRVEALALQVDRLERLPLLGARTRDLVVEQVGDAGLDGREWAPKVVRDGREEGLPEPFRLPVDLGLGGGPQEPVAFEHERELVAERPQDPALGFREGRAGAAEHEEPHVACTDAERQPFGRTVRRARIPLRTDLARRSTDRDLLGEAADAAASCANNAPASYPNMDTTMATISRYASTPGPRTTSSRERSCSVRNSSSRASAAAGPLVGPPEEDRDEDGQAEEDEEHDHVLGLADHERLERGDEVEVEDREAEDRRDDPRPDAPDAGGNHDDDEEPEPLRQRIDLVTERQEHGDQADRAGQRDRVGEHLPMPPRWPHQPEHVAGRRPIALVTHLWKGRTARRTQASHDGKPTGHRHGEPPYGSRRREGPFLTVP